MPCSKYLFDGEEIIHHTGPSMEVIIREGHEIIVDRICISCGSSRGEAFTFNAIPEQTFLFDTVPVLQSEVNSGDER